MTTTYVGEELRHWINGAAHRDKDQPEDRYAQTHDPSTGQPRARVPLATPATVAAAVEAAATAFPKWSSQPVSRRANVMFAYRQVLLDHADELAGIISVEAGKTLADAHGELARTMDTLDLCCSALQLMKGEFSEQVATGVDTFSFRQPLGVCAGITPFNFPVMLPAFMFCVAIVSGNTFVLKPSEQDPSAAVRLAELFAEAGLPPGVLNVVHGDKTAVDALIEHPQVKALSFIGSTPVAHHIYQGGASAGKRVQALGGAKNHMVVMPDADMDAAAGAAVTAAFGATGQRCMAVRVVVAVGDEAAEEFLAAARKHIAALRVGAGDDPDADVGPMISQRARDQVLGHIERGVFGGARLVVDGRDAKVAGHEEGYFLGPCLIDRVQPDSELYRDEIFGPVLLLMRARTLGQALGVVNANSFGNGSAIFTRDGGAARRFQREVRTGTVGVNVPVPVPVSAYGFAGWNDSRFGDLGLNYDSVAFFTDNKVVTTRWASPA